MAITNNIISNDDNLGVLFKDVFNCTNVLMGETYLKCREYLPRSPHLNV